MHCIESYKNAPKTLIAHLWYLSIGLSVVLILCALVAAVNNDKKGTTGVTFAAVWTVFLVIGLDVGGTMVLRKYRTPLAVGFFLGAVATMSQLMLVEMAIYAGLADGESKGDQKSSNQAAAAFSFFLFLVYVCFAIALGYYRNDIIDDALAPSGGLGTRGENTMDHGSQGIPVGSYDPNKDMGAAPSLPEAEAEAVPPHAV